MKILVSNKGAVYVEFLMVFLPMMICWLGLAQIGLMYGAHLMVGHAAARAARAAIVIIPDEKTPEDERIEAIRRAARLTLAPVSPGFDAHAGGAISNFLAGYV